MHHELKQFLDATKMSLALDVFAEAFSVSIQRNQCILFVRFCYHNLQHVLYKISSDDPSACFV